MGRIFTQLSVAGILFVWIASSVAYGQTMQGQLTDYEGNKAVPEVIITNIHTNEITTSDKDGKFSIAANSGQLLEFKKDGYKVVRFRVPQGNMASFYKVGMQRYNPSVPQFENMASPDYKTDSLKYAMLYKKELEFQQMTTLQAIQHPFSALSKRSRQIWAFQQEYAMFQEQKYIDYTFNDNLITSLTGLAGDSLRVYKQIFRPSYTQLRSMDEYNYFNYIKRTVAAYRKRGTKARTSPVRISH
ncbi:hypothetical protein CAP35_15315 [Chitinophagaceae bacterium IBVUCB1]|nr:hypothetical protein CAP35_15315 [Chitinophagaceae bacterium IBVUCB1]